MSLFSAIAVRPANKIRSGVSVLGKRSKDAAPGDHNHDWPGDVHPTFNPDPPTGCAFLLNQSVDVDRAPKLFALWGYTYGGAGDTFKLPDAQGAYFTQSSNPASMGTPLGFDQGHQFLKAASAGSHDHGTQTTGPSSTVFRGTAATLAASPNHNHDISMNNGHVHEIIGDDDTDRGHLRIPINFYVRLQ